MQHKDTESRLENFIAHPARALWQLAMPMMLGQAVQTIYSIADMIFVGRYSGTAVAALAFNMPLLFFAMGITFGLGSGMTAVIARFIGAKDNAKAEAAAATQDWSNAMLWANQWWQYQVKTADMGLRAKTFLEENGAKKVK